MSQGVSPSDRLTHLVEAFQSKQQMCSQLLISIEQDEVNIELESKRLSQLRSQVNEMKFQRHDLRQVSY